MHRDRCVKHTPWPAFVNANVLQVIASAHAEKRHVRIAFLGKGGSGKSTIAGTVARLLAQHGEGVLAADVDTMPGLSYSLGLGRVDDGGLPEDLAERRPGEGWVVTTRQSAEALVERHALAAPDGVRFLQLGKLPAYASPGATCAFRYVLQSFRPRGWSVVGDLAAGVRQAAYGWSQFATRIALVIEPTSASVLTALRVRALLADRADANVGCIVNKVRDDASVTELVQRIGLPLWAVVPFDRAVAAVERDGRAPLDAAAEAPAVAAIRRFVEEAAAKGLKEIA
jgi:CO dehydrogenase maturation factor